MLTELFHFHDTNSNSPSNLRRVLLWSMYLFLYYTVLFTSIIITSTVSNLCGCSHSFDEWLLLVLAWNCYIDILRYAAIWAHHQNLSIHLQRYRGPLQMSSLDTSWVNHTVRFRPILTNSTWNLHVQKSSVYRKQKQYWHYLKNEAERKKNYQNKCRRDWKKRDWSEERILGLNTPAANVHVLIIWTCEPVASGTEERDNTTTNPLTTTTILACNKLLHAILKIYPACLATDQCWELITIC